MKRSSLFAHMRHVLEARRIRPHFDVEFYLESNPDVRREGMDPVLHYVKWGWLEARDPHPDFSTQAWIARNPEIHASRRNPYLHYLTRPESPPPLRMSEADVAKTIADEFDVEWYLERNVDVAKSGTDPIRHYIRYGAKEGRNPNAEFSSAYYLAANPDVAEAGLNPFWHFIVAGRREGRPPINMGGERLETLSALRTLEDDVADWKQRAPEARPISGTTLRKALSSAARKSGRLVVSLSHDNYREHVGGVQLCIQFEEATARKKRVGFVNFHPLQPLMRLARPDAEDERLLEVSIDGTHIGTVAPDVAIEMLGKAESVHSFDVVIHSLLGHSTEFACELLDMSRRARAIFWSHDQFLICPNYLLQRNSINYCNAPAPDSQACGICKFGQERQQHLRRLEGLLSRPGVEIVSPSMWQTEFLKRKSAISLPKISTLPHARLKRSNTSGASSAGGPIRLAFAGSPMRFKGWNDFNRLADKLREPDLVKFFSYGSGEGGSNVKSKPVSVTDNSGSVMSDALAADDIDLVLMWGHGPETFSFVGHEALVAGAFIVTNERCGNVTALVEETGRGVVLDFECDLSEWLHSDECAALVKRRRKAQSERFSMSRGEKSISLLLAKESA